MSASFEVLSVQNRLQEMRAIDGSIAFIDQKVSTRYSDCRASWREREHRPLPPRIHVLISKKVVPGMLSLLHLNFASTCCQKPASINSEGCPSSSKTRTKDYESICLIYLIFAVPTSFHQVLILSAGLFIETLSIP